MSITDEERPGYFAAVNEKQELAEVGWLKFPKLMHIGWAAQWLQYEAKLRANLSRPALVVPIFDEEVRDQVVVDGKIFSSPALNAGSMSGSEAFSDHFAPYSIGLSIRWLRSQQM